MVHDIIEIDTDAESVSGFDDLDQLIFRAVASGDGAALILVAQIKWVENIIAD